MKDTRENIAYTEKGAMGFGSTENELLDLNYVIPSIENEKVINDSELARRLNIAYGANPVLTWRWVFYVRDARGGQGRRKAFMRIFRAMLAIDRATALNVIRIIPEYGYWKEVIELISSEDVEVSSIASAVVSGQLDEDIRRVDLIESGVQTNVGTPSLLAKWMPHINAGAAARREAFTVMSRTGCAQNPADYRKMLSRICRHLNVVENDMCARRWEQIDYPKVCSKANVKYRGAMIRHDKTRRMQYINDVEAGRKKINASMLYPHDIVNAMRITPGRYHADLEALWSNLPDMTKGLKKVIVVRDGSGSMEAGVPGKKTLTVLDIATALTIYFSERLPEPYKDKFITFSSDSRVVDLSGCETLEEKLKICNKQDDVSETNIKKVFDRLLGMAIKAGLEPSEMIDIVMIVSDMQFDKAMKGCLKCSPKDVDDEYRTLFEMIEDEWIKAGYALPKLMFWNIDSKTTVIPMKENTNGVVLASGYSTNTVKLALAGRTDAFAALVEVLTSSRYDDVEKMIVE